MRLLLYRNIIYCSSFATHHATCRSAVHVPTRGNKPGILLSGGVFLFRFVIVGEADDIAQMSEVEEALWRPAFLEGLNPCSMAVMAELSMVRG